MKNVISKNLYQLRKQNDLSQEALAEKIGVSRQTVAKWEAGDSMPDLVSCQKLSMLYHVLIDDILSYDVEAQKLPLPPKGKHLFGTVRLENQGQITLPAKACEVFHLSPGDELLVLGDEEQGIALVKSSWILDAMHMQ